MNARLTRLGLLIAALGAAAALANCGDDDDGGITVTPDAGNGTSSGTTSGGTSSGGTSSGGTSGQPEAGTDAGDGKDGPPDAAATNPNTHDAGDATNGKAVFQSETFGNEGFWTKAAKLPQGITAKQLTPVQALKAGLSVDVDKLDDATKTAVAAEIAAHPNNDGPLLNSFDTTVKLINANAVIGVVAVDTDASGTIDIAAGKDLVGVSCSLCHTITDGSVLDVPNGGSVGKRIDGPATVNLNVGAILAMAANSRAFFPMAQLKQPDGTSIGRAPSAMGLTKDSTEAEVDAYFSNATYYPVGTFDDTVDGNGNSVNITPLLDGNLAAPWGSTGEFQKLDHFNNTVYTGLFDLTNLLSDGGKATLHKIAGASGDALVTGYTAVLADTGVTGYPFVKVAKTGTPGDGPTFFGARVDETKLLDLNAYINSLPAPKGVAGDAAAVARGRALFRSNAVGCTNCHNVDQSKFVPPTIIDMKTIFPGDAPTVIATRDAPFSPIENTAASTFDDKMIVINASLRGLNRGNALPLLVDLARKPVFLHDHSVTGLEPLLDGSRGATAPHPFYVKDATQRADVITFLKSLDDTSK